MFNKLRKWLYKKKQEKDAAQWICGNDWAFGVLLRGEETLLSIKNKYGYDGSSFDQGVYYAIDKLIDLKIIEDDSY